VVGGQETNVLDLVYAVATIAFFGLSIAYALGCDRIARS